MINIFLSSLFLFVVSCKEDAPDHNPCLLLLKDGTCAHYKVLDKQNLKYTFVGYENASYVDGGFCLPKGELEKLIAYWRTHNQSCNKPATENIIFEGPTGISSF